MVAAVLLALGLCLWMLRPRTTAAPILAHLDQVRGEVYVLAAGSRRPAQNGQALCAGQGVQVVGEESAVVVRYPDGTRLELDADTTLDELSGGEAVGKKVVLAEGFLRAEVTPQPPDQPVVLATPRAEVIVQGTRLKLCNEASATQLETEKGVVQLTRKSDGRSVEVPAGFEAVINDSEPLTPQPLPPRFHSRRLTLSGYWGVAALSPDGRTLAARRFKDRLVALWDAATGQQRALLDRHTERVTTIAFSRDGRTLATGSLDQTVQLWDPASGQLRTTFEYPAPVWALTFSPDDQALIVLTGQEVETVALAEPSTRRRTILPINLSANNIFALSTDGQTLAVVHPGASASPGAVSTVTLWDLTANQCRGTIGGLTGRVCHLRFAPDGKLLAICHGSTVTLWDLGAGQVRAALRGPGGRVSGAAFSPDGTRLATGHRQEAAVRLWDIATGKQQAILEGCMDRSYAIAFGPEGKTLVTSEASNRAPGEQLWNSAVTLWDLPPR
ncbi:MAG TPA: FecR domain-containing protein [Gemmataceae bacterium]|nr:FecR domain-containing protein [Gemmataceae bacterium]